MRKMEEEEFDRLTKDIPSNIAKSCKHPDIGKLYYLGCNTDYGCLSCGMHHTDLDAFKR